MEPVTVYIKMDKNILVNKRNIKMQDIAKVYSSDKKVVNKINEIVVLNINAKRKHLYIFSVLKLFEEIHKICPNADMENIGEADFIIQFEPPKKKSQLLEFGKIAFVGLVIPNIIRLLVGHDYKYIISYSLIGGAFFLGLCDLLSR